MHLSQALVLLAGSLSLVTAQIYPRGIFDNDDALDVYARDAEFDLYSDVYARDLADEAFYAGYKRGLEVRTHTPPPSPPSEHGNERGAQRDAQGQVTQQNYASSLVRAPKKKKSSTDLRGAYNRG